MSPTDVTLTFHMPGYWLLFYNDGFNETVWYNDGDSVRGDIRSAVWVGEGIGTEPTG